MKVTQIIPAGHLGIRATFGTRVINGSAELIGAGAWRQPTNSMAWGGSAGGNVSLQIFGPVFLSIGGRYELPVSDTSDPMLKPAGRLVFSVGWNDTRHSPIDYFNTLVAKLREKELQKLRDRAPGKPSKEERTPVITNTEVRL